MRAILVNPFKREVTEVHADFNKLAVLQNYLTTGTNINMTGNKACLCAGPRLTAEVHTYVDDEGYYRPNQAWFRLKGYNAPLAGYMLVLSSTDDGDERDLEAYVTVERLASLISYTDEQDAAATIPPITITGFGGPNGVSYEEIPVDITHKRDF